MKGYVVDAALAVVLLLAYPVRCLVQPYARCRWCKAAGCRWCRSTGLRMRWGRRLYNAARARAGADR